ncbi:NAD-dependent epimerase/dehydratase family protein [Mariniphaga sediminis]|uniref:NAD-dependent epimerase/dehydratase family protein n=1 Tax=Mariniphaga sediminis TaxID=1628158 RepID=A0A399D061_9BACT|nr:NAD-dependent epimerase/dehydratase family protein [Mariniphaga sediminis]RIH65244.1 NAD-dependent epimerase/dehydratase family protein [Mariniphaga sediminis]
MQVILGAGGAIGKELARELKNFTSEVRLVGRNPQKINEDDELFRGDLTDELFVEKAVKGADVAYLTAGLPYQAKVWQEQWPVIMQHVISACKRHKCRLVFFDNIYLYHPGKLSPMIEETEINPVSKKGQVRAQIAGMLMKEVSSGKLEALIARSADFYGPGIENSLFMELIVKKLKAGKKANWFCSTRNKHNFTYTPDAAKATALLGNTESAFGQVWHLPTVSALTMQQWIDTVAEELKTSGKVMIISGFMLGMLGFFNPVLREMKEMLYQYDRDYEFDSSKFETVFKVTPTPVEEAIKEIVKGG